MNRLIVTSQSCSTQHGFSIVTKIMNHDLFLGLSSQFVTKVNEINLNELLIIHSEVSGGFYRFMIHSIVATF